MPEIFPIIFGVGPQVAAVLTGVLLDSRPSQPCSGSTTEHTSPRNPGIFMRPFHTHHLRASNLLKSVSNGPLDKVRNSAL